MLDTLVLADNPLPKDAKGRSVDAAAYYRNLKAWVARGGNLVLTDKAMHALGDLGLVDAAKVKDIKVYQPYTDFSDFTDPLARGLRRNARQLVEAAVLGYGIGTSASPMTAVDADAFSAAKGKVVGTTNGDVTLGRLLAGQGPGAADRRRAAHADGGQRPPVRPARLRPHLQRALRHGERRAVRRRRARCGGSAAAPSRARRWGQGLAAAPQVAAPWQPPEAGSSQPRSACCSRRWLSPYAAGAVRRCRARSR